MKSFQHSVAAATAATALFALLAQAAPSPTINNQLFKRDPADYTTAWSGEPTGATRDSPPLILLPDGQGGTRKCANLNNKNQAEYYCGTGTPKGWNPDCCKKICDDTPGCIFANHVQSIDGTTERDQCCVYNQLIAAGGAGWSPNSGTITLSEGYKKKISTAKPVGDGSRKLGYDDYIDGATRTYQTTDCPYPVVAANSNPNKPNVVTIDDACLKLCTDHLQDWNEEHWSDRPALCAVVVPEFANQPKIPGGENLLKYTCTLYPVDHGVDPKQDMSSYQKVKDPVTKQVLYTRIPGGVVIVSVASDYSPFTRF